MYIINNESKQKNILIVDDTLDNLRLLSKILLDNGYKVRAVSNGMQAIKTIKKELPDLILLDIIMPGMNGFEVCGRLKNKKSTALIPIIFLSALHNVDDKINAFKSGGVDYISKPFQVEEVLARIRIHLKIFDLQTELEEKNKQLFEKNEKLEKNNSELQEALENIKTLQGFIPICASCKKIRDDVGYWQDVAVYIQEHSEAKFSHGICPECMSKLYPDQYQQMEQRRQDIVEVIARLGQAGPADIALAVGLPVSNTLNRLEIMVEEKQVEKIEMDGQLFYRLPQK